MISGNPLITIVTVNRNSSEFIAVMLEALAKLTTTPYKVIIRDNGSSKKDFLQLKKAVSQYERVEMYRVETLLQGSMDHGTALNDLVGKIDTPFGVIMDADATFLMKGWDTYLLGKLSDQQPIIGTQADSHGGKPKDFPLMFACIFKTDVLKKLEIDFRPADISKFQDTGWELREKYKAVGLTGGLLFDFNTRHYKKGPFSEVACSEYYISQDGERLIASHFGRGSAPSSKKLVKISGRGFFSKVINKMLYPFNLYKWKKDKRRWLQICRSIIEKA